MASGTEENCLAVLSEIQRKRSLPPMSGRAVILLHGIIRSSKSFSKLSRAIVNTGATVVPIDYPSTQVSIAESAQYLKRVLSSLDGIDQIDLIGHSMGGLIVRTYLQMEQERRDARLHRLVMLGVPNLGAHMATLLHQHWAFRWTLGIAGQQLVEGDSSFISTLPVPDLEFGVIAGGRGTAGGWNWWIPGDDDGTVTVESTRLPGAADFLTVRTLHTAMMWNLNVIEASLRFLKTGAFREDGIREPILSAVHRVAAHQALKDL